VNGLWWRVGVKGKKFVTSGLSEMSRASGCQR
jgi:hypothetical protein